MNCTWCLAKGFCNGSADSYKSEQYNPKANVLIIRKGRYREAVVTWYDNVPV